MFFVEGEGVESRGVFMFFPWDGDVFFLVKIAYQVMKKNVSPFYPLISWRSLNLIFPKGHQQNC